MTDFITLCGHRTCCILLPRPIWNRKRYLTFFFFNQHLLFYDWPQFRNVTLSVNWWGSPRVCPCGQMTPRSRGAQAPPEPFSCAGITCQIDIKTKCYNQIKFNCILKALQKKKKKIDHVMVYKVDVRSGAGLSECNPVSNVIAIRWWNLWLSTRVQCWL